VKPRAVLLALPITLLVVSQGLSSGNLVSTDGAGEPEFIELSLAKVDLNTADLDDLLNIPGMSRRLASAILIRREETGCLRALSDLLGAGGITAPDLAEIRPYVFLGRGCREARGLRPGATLGWRSPRPSAGNGSWKGVWTWDLRLHCQKTSLRLRHSSGRTGLYGGFRLRAGPGAIILGEFRGRVAPALAFEPGRGSLSLSGPLPGSERAVYQAAGIATGSGERVRGVVLEVPGAVGLTALAGAQIKSWGGEAERFFLVSASTKSRKGLGLESGAAAWGKQAFGFAYVSTSWVRGPASGSSALAFRRKGGAWSVSMAARPAHSRRLGLTAAGRWGTYSNPIGLRLFRTAATSDVVYRLTCSTSLKYLGSLFYEEIGESGRAGKRYLTKVARIRKRFQDAVWMECEARETGIEDSGEAQDLSGSRRLNVKGIWRPPGSAWVELLFKGDVRDGDRSSLCGWRAGVDRGAWEVEAGGFSFRAKKSLYFYEKELAGLSSIKALKGMGLGWYLYLRLERPKGPRPMSFLGSTELKLRVVLDRDSPSCGTTFGLQFVWW
jgi:hypothetical protein